MTTPQSLPRFCPQCGTKTIADRKLCATCGLDISDEALARSSTQSPSEQSSRTSSEAISNSSSNSGVKAVSNVVTKTEVEVVASSLAKLEAEVIAEMSTNPGLEVAPNTSSKPDIGSISDIETKLEIKAISSQHPDVLIGAISDIATKTELEAISNPGVEAKLDPLSNSGLETTSNPPSNSGLEPASKVSSNVGLEPASKPPSRPVPKRPSVQTMPPSIETPPSRPASEALKEAAHLISGLPPYPPIPQASRQASVVDQPEVELDLPVAKTVLSLAEEAIPSMPTQILPQARVQESPQPQVQGPPQLPKPPQSPVQTRQVPRPKYAFVLPKRRLDRRGLSILIGLIVVLGIASFGLVQLLLVLTASPPGQPSITMTTLGTQVNYAGVDITVVNAQTSQSFLDDPNSTSNGMLRLQLRAQNKTSAAVNLPYDTITHVTLPNGKVLDPTYVKSEEHLVPNATVSDLIDFAVPQNVPVDQVVLHLGTTNEEQLDIPLNAHANVDRYAAKIVHPNQQLSYYGLNWTLTDASIQFHMDGKQASKGMRYLILTLKVNNPLSQEAIPGSPYNYVQLQANNTAINLVDTTLPVSFDGGASGKMGTLTFLVPSDDTSFALTFSNAAVDGFQASNTINFQF